MNSKRNTTYTTKSTTITYTWRFDKEFAGYLTVCRHARKKAPQKTPRPARILHGPSHPRIMETPVSAGHIHLSSRRFWSEICGEITCQSSNGGNRRELHSIEGLKGQFILWYHTYLGLQTTFCGHQHATICRKTTSQVFT